VLKEPFPIEASAADRGLQRWHSLEDLDAEQRAWYDEIRRETITQGASERTRWIYFRSPDWTWGQECGREGWLLYDGEARTQHAFLMTAMS
jgi:hypothetical protein